jgi:hypothetical protein
MPHRHLETPGYARGNHGTKPIQQRPMRRIPNRRPGRICPRAQFQTDDGEEARDLTDR